MVMALKLLMGIVMITTRSSIRVNRNGSMERMIIATVRSTKVSTLRPFRDAGVCGVRVRNTRPGAFGFTDPISLIRPTARMMTAMGRLTRGQAEKKRHSRAGGNPAPWALDSRLRGNDSAKRESKINQGDSGRCAAPPGVAHFIYATRVFIHPVVL